MKSLLARHLPTVIISVVVAVIFAGSAPWWWQYMPWEHAVVGASTTPVGFSGGCATFELFAQNRWSPYGTAVRTGPSPLDREVGSFDANHVIDVNGWVYGRAAYPTNTPPFNNNIWYHLADNEGWVSFAGVRSTPTSEDPSGLSADGGPPAPISGDCQGAVQ